MAHLSLCGFERCAVFLVPPIEGVVRRREITRRLGRVVEGVEAPLADKLPAPPLRDHPPSLASARGIEPELILIERRGVPRLDLDEGDLIVADPPPREAVRVKEQ